MTEELQHSRYGGSTRKRWGECPGSVTLIDTVPKLPSSEHAQRGTFAHMVAEYCLRQKMRSSWPLMPENHPWFDANGNKVELTGDICDAVDVYLEAVWDEIDASPDAELFIEQKFVLDVASVPSGTVFGRNDAMVYSRSRLKATVFDYKHGFQPVDPEDNEQGKFYGAGAVLASEWPIKEIEIVIVQPNSRDAEEKGAVKRWTWSVPEILDFVEDTDRAIAKAERASQLYPHLTTESDWNSWITENLAPGSWCRWCDAASVCPARQQQIVANGALQFKDVALVTTADLPEVTVIKETFSLDRLGKLLTAFDLLDHWMGQVRDYAYALAEGGTQIPGYKLVAKVARAKWQGTEDEIAAYLSLTYGIEPAMVMPPKLVTITEAEKLLGQQIRDKGALKAAKDDLRFRFTTKESSGVNLVPESHKGQAVPPPVASTLGTVQLPSNL